MCLKNLKTDRLIDTLIFWAGKSKKIIFCIYLVSSLLRLRIFKIRVFHTRVLIYCAKVEGFRGLNCSLWYIQIVLSSSGMTFNVNTDLSLNLELGLPGV